MRRIQRFFLVSVGAEQPAAGWSPGSMRPAHSSPRRSFSGTVVRFLRMVEEHSPGNKPGSLHVGLHGSWLAREEGSAMCLVLQACPLQSWGPFFEGDASCYFRWTGP
jgi:hypothetical protein